MNLTLLHSCWSLGLPSTVFIAVSIKSCGLYFYLYMQVLEDKARRAVSADEDCEQNIRLLSFCRKHRQPADEWTPIDQHKPLTLRDCSSYIPPSNLSGCARCGKSYGSSILLSEFYSILIFSSVYGSCLFHSSSLSSATLVLNGESSDCNKF